MMRAGDKFAIVCMKCRPKTFTAKDLVANGRMTMTVDGDLIIECSACGAMERYKFQKSC